MNNIPPGYPPPQYPPPPYNYSNSYPTPPPNYSNQSNSPHQNPPPRSIRTKPMYLEPPKPSNAIFVKNLPYNLTTDEFLTTFSQFGEIASFFPNHIREKGIAFVTYYNILSAIEAVDKMKNIKIHDRFPTTAFSFKPPNYSRVDPKMTSTIVLVQPNQPCSNILTSDQIGQEMSKFGQIHQIKEIGPNQITVQFCDMRVARHASEVGSNIDIGGIKCRAELYVEPDGEVVYQPVTPPHHSKRGHQPAYSPRRQQHDYQQPHLPPPPPPPPPPPQTQMQHQQYPAAFPPPLPHQIPTYTDQISPQISHQVPNQIPPPQLQPPILNQFSNPMQSSMPGQMSLQVSPQIPMTAPIQGQIQGQYQGQIPQHSHQYQTPPIQYQQPPLQQHQLQQLQTGYPGPQVYPPGH
ncbi:hypothetical protein TRFO_15193 [Tritrichomonas foetus]|uniref:RRM domain-containing protein n=1 Tax=Tritrichomonas foetus TaxID=1144522 RepID=A0A1J4KSZ3_9EUKA|nr:hypothetical protein TRFO_15193 [Tritrichomonas foetus]|eukprot:OHT14415.1 hypothetical protein TRFO_15193 [Tritrichomonas foetus]